MTLDWTTFVAILCMGLVTYLTRVTGGLLAGRLQLSPRLATALDAIPPVVLVAVVAPSMLATGKAETLASAITILAATRLPLLGVVASGVASIVLLRLVL
ncbi:AzlD family protein [Methylovirgula sp. 4M-Z18]|uniref:AzlD family protein n=1 Tax=Methylovirgula sp. 4M-Z18 TaxID=2293567 RepID=UPI000E2F00FA|nr:AzlD domain-containing protein [Methylovirgula sp. 4M-Z18]RFB79595.1 hypothetical protein DYH55_08870 [Methylovirgula sp. 4M-Z18]